MKTSKRGGSRGRRLLAVVCVASSVGATGCLSGGDNQRLELQIQELRDDLYTLRRERELSERRLAALEAKLGMRRPSPEPEPSRPPGASARPVEPSPEPMIQPREELQEQPLGESSNAGFRAGVAAHSAGNWARAQELLTQYVGSNASSPDAPEAQYLIADAYYAQANFPQAIVEYQKLVESYPRSQRVPAALYGMGLSYYELNYEANAVTHLERLVTSYPDSSYASEARPLLEKLRRR